MAAHGETYNYPRFKMSNYELGYFPGPKAGETVDYDFTLQDMDGKEVSLADYKGKWLVIESGSLTCPMYVKNVSKFAKLRADNPDIEWLLIYVREAHPGSKLGQANSMDEKIANAARNRDDYNEPRETLVDNLKGTWHHAWGLLPNMIYVINPDGQVVYRADWSFPHRVADVLENRDKLNTDEHVVILGAAPWITIPVAFKGGWDALYDILSIFPKVYYEHFKLDIQTWRAKRQNKAAPAAE